MAPKTDIICPDCGDNCVYECLVGKPAVKRFYCPECGEFVHLESEKINFTDDVSR